ncbi:MAG: carbohydrate-binding protein [Paludibacteraceae bacterium]|nr:carbohydrate-binding protein [Paludibacteraceae bacterium]
MKRLLFLSLVMLYALSSMAAKYNQKTQINVKGEQRTILIYAPDCLTDNRPLVISMHGMNQDIDYQKGQAQWELIADTANFVVVYPQSKGTTWDISGDQDINFVLTIIDEMSTRYNIDKNRVYLSGFSMGGMFTYHAMNKIADKIAAFAPISGYILQNPSFTSSRPCPLVHTHGTSDSVVFYDAGQYYGAENTVLGWKERNKCKTEKITTEPSGCCTKMEWTGGECDADVVFYSVKGRDHIPANDRCHHTSLGIWAFVKNYSLSCGKYSETGISVAVSEKMVEAPATVTITAKATLKESTVKEIKLFSNGELIETLTAEPYEYELKDLAVGTYEITATMTDNNGKVYESSAATINVSAPQQPYKGEAAIIPGKVEAENYDEGADGLAYYDSGEKNEEGEYREGAVDIVAIPDGGYALGYTATGEWIEYTIDAKYTDKYSWSAFVSSGLSSGAFKLYIDNKEVDALSIPQTADNKWDTYKIVEGKNELSIEEGKHILKIEFTGDNGNIDYLEFKALSSHGTDTDEVYSISLKETSYDIFSLVGEKLGHIELQEGDDLNQKMDESVVQKGTYILKGSKGHSRLFIQK